MMAVNRNNEAAVRLLLKSGATLSLGLNGLSPLTVAQDVGNATIIRLLESHEKFLEESQSNLDEGKYEHVSYNILKKS